jgi:hypothetical protein
MFLITVDEIQPALAPAAQSWSLLTPPMQRHKVMTKPAQQASLFALIFHKVIYWYRLLEGSRMKW